MTFQQTLSFGKIGEGYIAQWLRGRGFNVLPVYEKEIDEGKGPALFSVNGQIVAPDLLAFKSSGQTLWFEAKTKSAFTLHRISGKWVTGINITHYTAYLNVARLSPWPIWLLFLQLNGRAKDSPDGCPTGLFGRDLLYLAEHENHRYERGCRQDMVYWAHETLIKLATLDDVKSCVDTTHIHFQLSPVTCP